MTWKDWKDVPLPISTWLVITFCAGLTVGAVIGVVGFAWGLTHP